MIIFHFILGKKLEMRYYKRLNHRARCGGEWRQEKKKEDDKEEKEVG